MKHALLGTLFLLIGFGLSAHAQDKPRPVHVALVRMAALTVPWVAKERGIFARHGLDATLTEFNIGSDAVTALQTGDVDVIQQIPGTVIVGVERGFDLEAFIGNEVSHEVPPDSGSVEVAINSPIKTLADLKGRTVAIAGFGSQPVVGFEMLLRRAGLDPASVSMQELPFGAHADMLRTGRVDAVLTVDPYTTMIQASGIGRVIAWNYVESIPGQPLGAWWAKRATIAKKPDVIADFAASIREAIDYLNADPARARAEVTVFTGLDAKLVQNMPMIGWDYHVRPDKWQAMIDMMHASGNLQKPHKAAEYFAPQMAPYIVE